MLISLEFWNFITEKLIAIIRKDFYNNILESFRNLINLKKKNSYLYFVNYLEKTDWSYGQNIFFLFNFANFLQQK